MGQKQKQPQQDLFFEMTRMMVPRDFLEYFSVFEVKELKSEWQIVLHEKEGIIPEKLKGREDKILDGYFKPMQKMSHCFPLKPVYLVMKRRRWKQAGSDIHYSNEYTLTKDSTKLTSDMAGFLKI